MNSRVVSQTFVLLIAVLMIGSSAFVLAAPIQISEAQFYSDINNLNLETVTETFNSFPNSYTEGYFDPTTGLFVVTSSNITNSMLIANGTMSVQSPYGGVLYIGDGLTPDDKQVITPRWRRCEDDILQFAHRDHSLGSD